jgi:DNA-binding IclR family transcriptional regulator
LKHLAAEAGLSASAAHHYLVSYQRLGLVRQDRASLAYEIGPFALEMAFSVLGRSSSLNIAQEMQRRARDRLDESITLAVWGSHGPVIISVEESSKPVAATMRVGATLPTLRSVSGLTLLAYMPRAVVKSIVRAEYAAGRLPVGDLDRKGLELVFEKIRSDGLANHSDYLLPGFAAVAVPMLDAHGRIAAAMAAFGSSKLLDYSLDGLTARVLLETASAFTAATRQMGTL